MEAADHCAVQIVPHVQMPKTSEGQALPHLQPMRPVFWSPLPIHLQLRRPQK